METQDIKDQLTALKNEIEKHSRLYYMENNPEISDVEFDALVREYEELEKRYPHLSPSDSPTKQVGYEAASEFKKVKHQIPMLSLSNAFTDEDIENFINRIQKELGPIELEFTLEPKIDGLSFSAIFENGVLTKAATRGDGFIGEDVTMHIKTLINFPHVIDKAKLPELFEVRGEIYLDKQNFEKLNNIREAEGLPLFSNPRNAASGSLRQLDHKITASRGLRYFIYGLGKVSSAFASNHYEALMNIKMLGFEVNPHVKLAHNLKEIIAYYNEIEHIRDRLDYEIDGTVYKLNSYEMQEKMGFIARAPRFAVAHKFESMESRTKLLHIVMQVGRTGVITPVAELEPVNIGGAMVSRVSLHNKDEIERKDIREGDLVFVKRAGDVIPKITAVDKMARADGLAPFTFPGHCPSCNAELQFDENEAAVRCINHLNCRDQIIDNIVYFVSRDAFNIEGLAIRQIEFLYEKNFIKNVADIFKLEKINQNSLTKLEFFHDWGKKSVQNLFENIEKARKIEFYKLIYSLGIRHIGEVNAKILADQYDSFNEFYLDMLRLDDENIKNKLLDIKNIGIKAVSSLEEFFKQPHNIKIIDELLAQIEIIYPEKTDTSHLKFSGKVMVITGIFEEYDRNQLKKILESKGAKISSSISSNTHYLVAGEKPGSKLQKAKELGVEVIGLKEVFSA